MSPSAVFQLESLSYQTDAFESVVRVFEGTLSVAQSFELKRLDMDFFGEE